MKLTTLIASFACLLAVGCGSRSDQREPETGNSRIVFEMRDEAQKDYAAVQREMDAARGQLAELRAELAQMKAAVEPARSSRRKTLEDRERLQTEVERLARPRDLLSEQTRASARNLEELHRQTDELRQELETLQTRERVTSGLSTQRDHGGQDTLSLTGRVEISAYGNAAIRLPVGDGYLAAGGDQGATPATEQIPARPAETRALAIQEAKQALKEYLRQKAIPEGYRVSDITGRRSDFVWSLRRARTTGGYRPFYFPEGDDPQLYVELYVDRAARRAYYRPRPLPN